MNLCKNDSWNYIDHLQSKSNIWSMWVKFIQISNTYWFQWGRSSSFQQKNSLFCQWSQNEQTTFIKENSSFQCVTYNKKFYFVVAKCHTSLGKAGRWRAPLFVFVNNKDNNSYTEIGNSKILLLNWLLPMLQKYDDTAIIIAEEQFHHQRLSLLLLDNYF